MNNADSKNKNYTAAKEAWQNLVKINSQRYAQLKVMHCLPKHKQKYHSQLLTQINVTRFNAVSAWNKASEKLTDLQLGLLRGEALI